MSLEDVWDFHDRVVFIDRSSLSEKEQQIAAICDLSQEVNSGGFDSYFRYSFGGTAPVALAGLPTLLGSDWADLLAEAMALLGEPYLEDPDERSDRLDALDIEDALDELDDRYYALEASIDADAKLTAALHS